MFFFLWKKVLVIVKFICINHVAFSSSKFPSTSNFMREDQYARLHRITLGGGGPQKLKRTQLLSSPCTRMHVLGLSKVAPSSLPHRYSGKRLICYFGKLLVASSILNLLLTLSDLYPPNDPNHPPPPK